MIALWIGGNQRKAEYALSLARSMSEAEIDEVLQDPGVRRVVEAYAAKQHNAAVRERFYAALRPEAPP